MMPLRVLTRSLRPQSQCFQRHKSTSSHVNAKVQTSKQEIQIDPLKSKDFFGVHQLFNMEDLFKARVHLGHKYTAVADEMKPFIYGKRFDTAIINLDETALLLRQALNFLAHVTYRGGIVLFLARQPQLTHLVEKTAIESGEYAQCRPWITRSFTASEQIFGDSIRLPDVMIFLHTKEGTQYSEHVGIRDAAKLNVPTIGIVDSDCNPNMISYPIPGNDDSIVSQQLYLHLFKQTILLAKKRRKEDGLD